jgi:hypothetical protein
MTGKVKVQAFAGMRVIDVVFDLIRRDGLIAHLALLTGSVPGVNFDRQQAAQSSVVNALQDAQTQFILRQHRLGGHVSSSIAAPRSDQPIGRVINPA